MKIFLIADAYPTLSRFGGIGVYTRTAARALAERGHEVHILVGTIGKSFDTKDNSIQIHVRPVRWLPFFGRWLEGLGESLCLAWALFLLHRRYKFDIVEFPNWEGKGLVSAFLSFVPVVVHCHSATPEEIVSRNRQPKAGEKFMAWAERQSARLAKATVTHSEAHRKKSMVTYGLRDIHLITHGIEIPKEVPLGSSNLVLYVGNLSPRKGIENLFDAIPLVLSEVPNAEFVIVGNDPDHQYERLFRRTHPKVPAEKVRFPGFVSDTERDDLYDKCAVFASASSYESFGFTFLEAMAHGRPVVGIATSAIPEVVQDGETGILVPPKNPQAFAHAIVRPLKDRHLRSLLGRKGRQVVLERYSSARMAEAIEKFYGGVLNSKQ